MKNIPAELTRSPLISARVAATLRFLIDLDFTDQELSDLVGELLNVVHQRNVENILHLTNVQPVDLPDF